MATNDFKAWAISPSANVISQEEFEELSSLSSGFMSGKASSAQINKLLRQSSTISSIIGEFISTEANVDSKDNGNVELLLNGFVLAVKNVISTSIVNNVYPVGSVKLFASNVNPNILFPGTTWKYIGIDKTIRLADPDGSDVLETGGNDSVTLNINNLPAHGHSFSGTTDSGGEHTHDVEDVDSSLGDTHGWFGENGAGLSTVTTSSNGSHEHSFSGTTENTGDNTAVDIKNSYVKLMGWYRTA